MVIPLESAVCCPRASERLAETDAPRGWARRMHIWTLPQGISLMTMPARGERWRRRAEKSRDKVEGK
eukprot:8356024-Pyramimonas_sp.AAC.1